MSDYEWMQNTCYEPRPLPRRKPRASLFISLAVIAMGVGVLVGLMVAV